MPTQLYMCASWIFDIADKGSAIFEMQTLQRV